MRRFKYIIQLFLAIIFICFIVFIHGKYSNLKEESILSNIEISISNEESYNFVTHADIYENIDELMIIKDETRIVDIPLRDLEENIEYNPYVSSVEVYSDILGTLHIKVEQFVPCLRFIDSDGLSYFVDNNSNVVAQRGVPTFDTPIVTQEGRSIPINILIDEAGEDTQDEERQQAANYLSVVSDFANYMRTDSICSSLFSQISISAKGDIELVPRIGRQYVIFSSLDSLVNYKIGIEKMLKFYESESSKGVWNNYNVVNIKYNGQVVCKK